jgi:hypothetical protein
MFKEMFYTINYRTHSMLASCIKVCYNHLFYSAGLPYFDPSVLHWHQGITLHFWHIIQFLPDYMAQYPGRQSYSDLQNYLFKCEIWGFDSS